MNNVELNVSLEKLAYLEELTVLLNYKSLTKDLDDFFEIISRKPTIYKLNF